MLTTLAHFRIVQKLGKGGMGEVYLAEDTRLHRKAALKVLPPELASHPDRLRRFEQEACAASALSHPNILVVYETGADAGRHYIATEYVEGQTLRRRLAVGGMSVGEGLDVAAQVASALVAAHEAGIVHRDIKPENVMIRADGYVKVVDFGLAKLGPTGALGDGDDGTETRTETEPGKVMGTVQYMSPEQARGLPVDERTDIFSLGIILYEALAGHPPFRGETRSDVLASLLATDPPPLPPRGGQVTAELRWVLGKMLRKDRDERYQTAKELLGDLRRAKQELERPVLAPAAPTETSARPRRRFPRLAVALLAALVGAPVAFYLSRTHTSSSQWARTGGIERTGGLVRYDAGSRTWVPHLWGMAAQHVDFSRDGKWIVYVDHPEGTLCRSRADGSDRTQLTYAPLRAAHPRWSPDRKRIAFVAALPDKRWKLHVLPAGGGPVQPLLPQDREERSPSWAPDGRKIVFAVIGDPDERQIRILDVATGNESAVPGSQGKMSPRWSPDGDSILALTTREQALVVLDVASGRWSELVPRNVSWPQWTRDGRHVYYQAFDGPTVFRVRVADKSVDTWAKVDDLRRVRVEPFGSWLGLTPDDSPLILARRAVTERSAAPPGP